MEKLKKQLTFLNKSRNGIINISLINFNYEKTNSRRKNIILKKNYRRIRMRENKDKSNSK